MPSQVSADYVAGQLEGLSKHLEYQDKQRTRMHDENRADIGALKDDVTAIKDSQVSCAIDHKWIEEVGKRMNLRVEKLETARTLNQGKLIGMATVYTGAIAIASAYGKDIVSAIVTWGGKS